MATINTKRINSDDPYDFYRTQPEATMGAIRAGVFKGIETAWDPCDGIGGISLQLEKVGISVERSDISDYGLGGWITVADFLELNEPLFDTDCIVMNPPFRKTFEFVEKALQLSDKVIMFNRVSFLESDKRGKKFKSREWPLSEVFIHSRRVGCAKGFSEEYTNAVMYCWFVFDNNCTGDCRVHWI